MRDESKIRKVLKGMDEHAHFITDAFRRWGFDNFRSGLEFVLNDDNNKNNISDVNDLSVGYVQLNGRDVNLKER